MRWLLITAIVYIGFDATGASRMADRECKSCQKQGQTQPTACQHQTPVPSNRHVPPSAAPVPLGERGYNLAGDYDIVVSRSPLFNTSIKDPTNCVRFQDSDGFEKSIHPPSNFLTYRYFSMAAMSTRSFTFRLFNVYPTLWDAYIDFRRRSSFIIDSTTKYDDLFSTLTNIGVGKQQVQTYYKRFQRSVLDKRVSFYHVRAQVVHGEFEMKKPIFNSRETHFSTPFLNYIQQNILTLPENGTGVLWDEKFFVAFGTHYVRRGLFGGYIDLMISPWDIVCEVPVPSNLSSLARCITAKLNKKFGLAMSTGTRDLDNTTCAGFSFWMQNDQDVLAMVSGSDYDFQTAVSIGVRYPVYEDHSDKPLIRGWLHSLYDAPGLIEAVLEPICEVFPEGSLLKKACEKNLLRYMRMNEPLLRTMGQNAIEECDGGKRLVFDMGFNNMRDGCVSTTRYPGICPRDETGNGAEKQGAGMVKIGMILIFWGSFLGVNLGLMIV